MSTNANPRWILTADGDAVNSAHIVAIHLRDDDDGWVLTADLPFDWAEWVTLARFDTERAARAELGRILRVVGCIEMPGAL